jgi:hypothetical protein
MNDDTQDEEDKEKTCQEILGLLQSCVSDQHPRVRYAVMYTIGQMALAFEVSIPLLVGCISDFFRCGSLICEGDSIAGRGLSGFSSGY